MVGEDLTGKRFGKLIVQGRKGNDRWGKVLWDCACDCGGTTTSVRRRLIKGSKTSCGCYHKGHKGSGALSKGHWYMICAGAKQRGIEIRMTIEEAAELFEKQKGRCALTGRKIELSNNIQKKRPTASLDRIDSNGCYTKGNVQWLHKDVNMAKREKSNEEFILMCQQVAQWNKKARLALPGEVLSKVMYGEEAPAN